MNYKELGDLASEVITKVMRDGENKYPNNDFMKRSLTDHYDHAVDHIISFRKGCGLDDLEHAITRLVIIRAKINKDWNS